MKKNKWMVLSTAALLSALVLALEAACAGGAPAEGGARGKLFTLRNIAASAHLDPEQAGDGPRLNMELSLLEASGPENTANFFNPLLYGGPDIDTYQAALVEEYRERYRVMSANWEGPYAPRPDQDWEYVEKMAMTALSSRWLVIGRERESYTGGAHGMIEKIYYVVDLAEPKLLTLEDLFTDPGDPGLYRLVQNALREYAGLEQNASLSSGPYFEDDPYITSDFFLNREGLGFHWNPYEIAPYSERHIEVVIPWEKLAGLLNAYGRELAEALNTR
jgi:hypothetical protein